MGESTRTESAMYSWNRMPSEAKSRKLQGVVPVRWPAERLMLDTIRKCPSPGFWLRKFQATVLPPPTRFTTLTGTSTMRFSCQMRWMLRAMVSGLLPAAEPMMTSTVCWGFQAWAGAPPAAASKAAPAQAAATVGWTR